MVALSVSRNLSWTLARAPVQPSATGAGHVPEGSCTHMSLPSRAGCLWGRGCLTQDRNEAVLVCENPHSKAQDHGTQDLQAERQSVEAQNR